MKPRLRISGAVSSGCLVALVAVVCLVVLAVGGAIYAFFYTSLPFRWMAAGLERADPNISITGVSGSLNTGPSIDSIRWGTGERASEIEHLRIKYNGFSDIQKNRQLVFYDVGVSKAHLDFTGVRSHSTETILNGKASRPSQGTQPLPANVSVFRIDRVLFEDVLLTDHRTGLHVEIPKIEWTGFKTNGTLVEPGDVTVQSDRLEVRTQPGRDVTVEGKTIPFQKRVEVMAKPLLHPALREPLAVTFDFTLTPAAEVLPWHIATTDGSVEFSSTTVANTSWHFRNFDAARIFNGAAIFGKAAADLPAELTFDATVVSDPASLVIPGGHFKLGQTRFEIQPFDFAKQTSNPAALSAVARVGDEEITWSLPIPATDEIPSFHPGFRAKPELPLPEILARIFAAKPYGELTPDERTAVDERVSAYALPKAGP